MGSTQKFNILAQIFRARHVINFIVRALLNIPYSGLFSRGNIFANFANRKQFVKILPSKYLLFNWYSLQFVTIHENFPLEKLGIA